MSDGGMDISDVVSRLDHIAARLSDIAPDRGGQRSADRDDVAVVVAHMTEALIRAIGRRGAADLLGVGGARLRLLAHGKARLTEVDVAVRRAYVLSEFLTLRLDDDDLDGMRESQRLARRDALDTLAEGVS